MPLVDLNPFGHNTISRIPAVVERYKFLQAPSKFEEFDPAKGIKFLGGTFLKNGLEIVVELTIFSDGLIADTRSSTDDSDAFLDDLLTWQAERFGNVLYHDVLRSKLYLSELWVRSGAPLDSINPKLKAFSERLTLLISSYSDTPINYKTSSIGFSTQPGLATPPAPFKLERALDAPFKQNRYYAVAPLPTGTHLELLDELESILAG